VLPLYFYVNKHLVKPWVTGWSDNVMNIQYSKNLALDGGLAGVRNASQSGDDITADH